jgi:hypothetical protein
MLITKRKTEERNEIKRKAREERPVNQVWMTEMRTQVRMSHLKAMGMEAEKDLEDCVRTKKTRMKRRKRWNLLSMIIQKSN